MLQLIKHVNDIANEKNLKLASRNAFFELPTVKYLGRQIGFIRIEPIQPKKAAINKVPCPTDEVHWFKEYLHQTNS